jgi:IPT/TIG domain
MYKIKLGHACVGARALLSAAIAVTVALALPLASTPARAATLSPARAATLSPAGLTGGDWTAASLPAGTYFAAGRPAPVSCVPGSQFCLAIAYNDSVAGPSGTVGQSALVTTDGGTSWTAYTTLPAADFGAVLGASCVTTSICWIAGSGPNDQPEVADTTDGGQTWTLQTPASWADAPYSWWANSIDCVTATTCWVAGETANGTQNPVVAETTDGVDWTTFTNLPAISQYDPNGTYLLNAISCISALDCVAGGGLDDADGLAQVIFTTDGGATWTLSTDPTLTGVQEIFSLSCLPGGNGLPYCTAAADAVEAGGPVVITAADGGATWSGMETYDDTGWMSSVSCPDTAHCWAAGAGTTVGLVGTADGGTTWSDVMSDTSNEYGTVSCASVTFCAATVDNALWVTTDDGGLDAQAAAGARLAGARPAGARPAGAGLDEQAAARKPVTTALPHVSGSVVSGRTGRTMTVTGQYRRPRSTKTVTVTIRPPSGHVTTVRTTIGLNDFYSVSVKDIASGATKVTAAIGRTIIQTVAVHGYTGPAPAVRSLSAHAGPLHGGALLTIRGSGFRGVSGVYFGTARAGDLHVLSSSELTVHAPAGSRSRFVTVVTRDGGPSGLTGRAVFNYLPLPAVRGLLPGSGPASGGNTVTITGTGFGYVTGVYFGRAGAAHVKVISAREIRVTAPRGTGTVQVTVVTAGGRTPGGAASSYAY